MKKHILTTMIVLCVAATAFTGCGSKSTPQAPAASAVTSEVKTEETENKDDKVADKSDMAEVIDVVEEGMEPIYADSLNEGEYNVKVDSSSSMFNIEECVLTVKDGEMTAVMTMGGTGYKYLFMGTGEEAVDASEESYIPFEETEDGKHTFTVPVQALDMGIDCSAFSKKKEKWYDRVILFRADSLSSEAYKDGFITTTEALGLEDGEYSIEVALEGGSGKAHVESPTKLIIENGEAFAEITWSSKNYDYMKINDEMYDTINTEGNSVFKIPVSGFDYKMPVLADTTAMGTPHEIEYTLTFDSSSIKG